MKNVWPYIVATYMYVGKLIITAALSGQLGSDFEKKAKNETFDETRKTTNAAFQYANRVCLFEN